MEGRRGSGGTDFMRYVFMGLAVVLVILLAVIMVNVYRSSMREDVNIVIIDETETENGAKPESESESGTPAADEAGTEASETAETSTETKEAETAESTAATEASESAENAAATVASESAESTAATEAAETAESAAVTEAAETAESTAAEAVQTPETAPAAEAAEAAEAAAAEEAAQEPNIVIENTEPAEDDRFYVTIASTCNFRSTAGYTDASGNDSTMWELPGGTVVELLQDNGGWAMIQVDGTVGYVGSKFLAY